MRKLLFLLLAASIGFGDDTSSKYIHYLQTLPSKTKKHRFYKLVVPAVKKVDARLRKLYLQTLQDIKNGTNKKRVQKLKRYYQASDELDLLKRIKPHPMSITIAQAAMESAWGTSRFFVEANNIFGVWSRSEDPKISIAANVTRSSGKTVRLRRYLTLEASVRGYYKTLATNKAYKCFREVRYFSDDPFEIVIMLHKYSEKGKDYPLELIKIIKHNNLTKYDNKTPLPRLEAKELLDENASNPL